MSNVTSQKDKAMQIGVIAVSHNYIITQKIILCGLLYKFSKLRKTIKEYLEDEAKESRHEAIRGNVLLATRYFNDRVKKFMNLIVMGTNNPMRVEYYTYKVEFQDRGAGHIHGTLWLKLKDMENLIRGDGGALILGD